MARFFESTWTRFGLAARQSGTKRPRSARPAVEALEDRTLPTISIDAAGLVSVIGTPHDDKFLIRVDPTLATQLQFSDDGGTTFTSFAATKVTAVDVQGLGGHDVLTIDNSAGLVGETSNLPISFLGGKGFDELVLSGNPKGAAVTETYTIGKTFGAGTLAVGDGTTSATITITDVESVVDTLTANQLTINANDNPNLIKINDGPTVDGMQTTRVRIFNRLVENGGDSNGNNNQGDGNNNQGDGKNQGDGNNQGNEDNQGNDDGAEDDRHGARTRVFTPITFANKTNVTINGLGGNDVFILNNPHPAAGLSQLTLDGGSGQNVVIERNVPPGVTLTLTNIQKTVTDSDDAVIEELFEEDLGRDADAGGLASWKANLHNGMGLAGVTAGIEDSAEARTLFVKRLYVQYLGRNAQNGEEQGWVNSLMQGGSEENVIAGIAGSTEFQQRAQTMVQGGSANERTVQAFYSVFLGRTADSAEAAGWMNALQMEGGSAVAMGFLQSAEFRTSAVDTTYQSLLGREADQGGLMSWVGSNLDLHTIRRGIEASAEFAQSE
jgi:hypothetical protein